MYLLSYSRAVAAMSLDINPTKLNRWIKKVDSDEGQSVPGNRKVSPGQVKIWELQMRVKRLEMVKEFFKMETVFFAAETM